MLTGRAVAALLLLLKAAGADVVRHTAAADFPACPRSAPIAGSTDPAPEQCLQPEGFPWSSLETAYPLCCIATPTGHVPSVPSPATAVSTTAGVSPGLAVRPALLSCSHGRT